MAKKRRGEDPVARLQEEARWSSFTNSWSRRVAPGAPRWVRRMIIAAFVLMAVVGGVVGLIELLARDDSAGEPFNDCVTHETTATVSCIELFTISPTVP
jgi:hypothetical protein